MAVAAIPYVMAGVSALQTINSAQQANESASKNYRSLLINQIASGVMQEQTNKSRADQASSQLGTLATQALAEKSRLITSASEAGVGGSLLDRLNNEIVMKQQDASQNVLQSNTNDQMSMYAQGQARQAQAQSQANQIEAQAKAASPGPLGLALRIGGQVAGAYFSSQTYQMGRTTPTSQGIKSS